MESSLSNKTVMSQQIDFQEETADRVFVKTEDGVVLNVFIFRPKMLTNKEMALRNLHVPE